MDPRDGVPRSIVGFHRDEEGHWVADLDCGHGRHVRHEPPFRVREWTQSEAGRQRMLGVTLACRKCLDDPPDGSAPPTPS